MFIGSGDGADGKNRTVNLPVGTVCEQKCGKECRSKDPRNPTDSGYDDIHCNETVGGADSNRLNFHRCDERGNGVNDSWRFDLEMPCTLKPRVP